MIITDSQVRFEAEHYKHEVREQYRALALFTNALGQARGGVTDAESDVTGASIQDIEAPRAAPDGLAGLSGTRATELLTPLLSRNGELPLRLNGTSAPEAFRQLFWRLLRALTGAPVPAENPSPTLPDTTTAGATRPGKTLQLRVRGFEHIETCENTRFGACGRIDTADGVRIDFELSLEMSRQVSVTRVLDGEAVIRLKDPLVINFDGNAADLTEERLEFDLDADGETESIHRLAAGSGFLALDRNGDGTIGSGEELFGALSGDGFGDLALYDQDGNGWIDEADPVFQDLRIWQPDTPTLSTLKERGVGALYLGATQTPFTLADGQDNTRGQVRESGIYLNDEGGVGTLQEIDLRV